MEEVAKISWWEVYSCQNVDTAVEIFTKKLTDILDKMAPVKKLQIRTRYAPWVSEDTKDRIKERDKAQQAATRSGTKEDWELYKQLRNTVTSQLKKEKIEWQKVKLDDSENGNNSGKLWKNIVGWLGWTSALQAHQPSYSVREILKPPLLK